ncbi:1-aminocyclopropane-1-carboxylate oxidase-like 1 [Spatholobus suberectus]|nr:1-aminocyclopropane-1-carboxylate oxidase-like 1 [Spatholobus suberectus]
MQRYTAGIQEAHMKLGILLFEFLSEALELTMGTPMHSDDDFLTVLLQDHIGGLQVRYHDKWIDINPVPGALVVNIGDLLQLITNDRFKSAEQRVLANHVGPNLVGRHP